ncbi:MAG: YkgJ family cysteine cluster protein [Bacteroidetes bacterium]|nr:YkgJ family cysteine cluster protein [Bacteroidota bacterium]
MTLLRLLTDILRARRNGLLQLRKADKPVRLECIGGECGLCCEILGKGVVVTEEESRRFTADQLERRGKSFVLKSTADGCCFLKDKACSCYNDRPQGCRDYPWYQVYGQLYYDSGCPGMKFDRDERPPAGLIVQFRNYLPKQEGWMTRVIKFWVTH